MNSVFSRAFLSPVLFIACGLTTAACGLATYARDPAPATTKPHPFESEIAAFENWDRQNAFPKNPVLFVGSSSIRLWQTAVAFPDMPVINRGFGGSTISDVNHFFGRIVLKYKPRVVVFYSGDNDIAGGKSPQRVFDDFKKFVEMVHVRLPETRIFVVSIKPSIARQKMWPKMKEANALIARLAEVNEQLEFVDVATPMLAGHDLPSSTLFLDDGLHLNADGYKLWDQMLKPVLADAMKRD